MTHLPSTDISRQMYRRCSWKPMPVSPRSPAPTKTISAANKTTPPATAAPPTANCSAPPPTQIAATPSAGNSAAHPLASLRRTSPTRRRCCTAQKRSTSRSPGSWRHRPGVIRSVRLRLPHQQHADANHRYADPPLRRTHFVQHQNRQHRLHRVAKRARGHHKAVIRPAYRRHVAECESNQEENPDPDASALNRGKQRVLEPGDGNLHVSDLLHPPRQHQVAGVRAHHHQQDHYQRLESQPMLVAHSLELIVAAGR